MAILLSSQHIVVARREEVKAAKLKREQRKQEATAKKTPRGVTLGSMSAGAAVAIRSWADVGRLGSWSGILGSDEEANGSALGVVEKRFTPPTPREQGPIAIMATSTACELAILV